MAKKLYEESNIQAIADAIREKNGETTTYKTSEMAAAIINLPSGGGGGIEVEPIVLTGSATYALSGDVGATYLNLFGNTISTNNLSNCAYMFATAKSITKIPFDINIQSGSCAGNNMFYGCYNLKDIPDIDFKHTSNVIMRDVFYDCRALTKLPSLYNVYPNNMTTMFYGCHNLRELPEDYFDTWNFSRMNTYAYAAINTLFKQCYSLRKMPKKLFEKYQPTANISSTSSIYYNLFEYCYTLDEITDLPVYTSLVLTSSVMSSMAYHCKRLKRFTFATNNGEPIPVQWKSQVLYLSNNTGYNAMPSSIADFVNYNSGITADKEVKDDATYQALKNDPDWFTCNVEYSRYNHDSAVETINSLPDASAYVASGTYNTIQFLRNAGSKTDGGAIGNLTEEEIAVAAAKGWTVTLV